MSRFISTYLANKLLNHVYRNTPYTPPTAVYVGLLTGPPSVTDVYSEVAGTGYARQVIAFDPATARITKNTSAVVFPVAGTDWGYATHWATFDAFSTGNLLNSGVLTPARLLDAGPTTTVPVGRLVVEVPFA